MFKDRNRFIITFTTLFAFLIAFFDNIENIYIVIFETDISGILVISLYTIQFFIGIWFLFKSLFVFLMEKKLKKQLFWGLYLMILNFSYSDISFTTFPLLDLSLNFSIFDKGGVGINFTILIIIGLYKSLFNNAPLIFDEKYNA